jgi:predicted N-acyltransferase
LLIRQDVQFHWQNNAYIDFEHFLADMNSRKRKKIARERRRVAETGVSFHVLSGEKILPSSMKSMFQFYLATVMAHGSQAYLNEEFFLLLGKTMANDLVMIEAHFQGEIIAAALNIRHQTTLYGRYWGCKQTFNSLHFETCYYQAIDYCIGQNLDFFEGGAQGEHKLSRGFLPVITSSAHWMADARLSQAVNEFLTHEKEHVAHYQQLLNEHSPFTNCSEKD